MGENNIKLGTGSMFLTTADGVQFKLGDAAEIKCTEAPAPSPLALGRTNGITSINSSPTTFTCTARINKKLLHKLLHRYPYNPRRRRRNEKKAVHMMYFALYRRIRAMVLAEEEVPTE